MTQYLLFTPTTPFKISILYMQQPTTRTGSSRNMAFMASAVNRSLSGSKLFCSDLSRAHGEVAHEGQQYALIWQICTAATATHESRGATVAASLLQHQLAPRLQHSSASCPALELAGQQRF